MTTARWLVLLLVGCAGGEVCGLPSAPGQGITSSAPTLGDCGPLPASLPPPDCGVVLYHLVDSVACEEALVTRCPVSGWVWSVYTRQVAPGLYEGTVDLAGPGHCDYTFTMEEQP